LRVVDFFSADADGYRARREGAARVRRDRLPADVHHVAGGELVGALAEVP
jgi:hypothetical protein